MNRPNTLTTAFVKNVNQAGRYGDGRGSHGLSLLVKPTTNGRWSRSWSQRVRINGRITSIGLGSYPIVTLAKARARALDNRRKIDDGIDPRAPDAPTLREATERVIELHRSTWRTGSRSEKQWRSSLETYAYPRLASKPVAEITSGDVLAVLSPIWGPKPETARRVRGRISSIMQWAVAEGYRDDNPAGDAIRAALPKHNTQKKHQRTIPHSELSAALDTVRKSNAYPTTKLAFEFLVLTACRSGEVRGARWGEVSLKDRPIWTVPASRSKTGRPHRVPIVPVAKDILMAANALRDDPDVRPDDDELIFPSPTSRQLSDNTLTKLLRELGIDAVPHGMRSAFRSWAAENNVNREVAEQCLAHVVRGVEGAYQRSDLLESRGSVMVQWSEYVVTPQKKKRGRR